MSTARSYSWQLAAAALCALLCTACGGDDDPKKGVTTTSSGTGAAAAGGSGGSGAAGTGGTGTGGGGGGGGGGGVGGSGGGTPGLPVCVWPFWETFDDTPQITTAADDHLGSLSKDEYTIAWMTPNGEVHVAERTSKGDPFPGGSYTTLAAAAGYYAFDRVALSPDGLRLVVVSTDRTKLGRLTRASTGDTFAGQPDETPFAAINASVSNGESLGDPINVEDERLYYSRYSGASTTTIYYATHSSPSDPWTLAGSLDDAELQQSGGFRMVPTAMTKDHRGLFYWDEETNQAFMASRDYTDGAFLSFEMLGPFMHATPGDDCSRLYYTDTSTPRDIRYADPP